MTELYLHHYAESPFSEKIRALLGYLELDWHSVNISNIMPRPDLMPLSGGYRKTPIMQDGANILCDSKVIARYLVHQAGNNQVYAPGFLTTRLAEWADTTLFQTAVAICFQPRALAAIVASLGADTLVAFQEDRAKLTEGASITSMEPALAEASFTHYLRELESSLNAPFLFGTAPSIADFSVYHGLWFVKNNPVVAPLLEGYAHVADWFERMQGFAAVAGIKCESSQALAAAKAATPKLVAIGESLLPEAIAVGDPVTVTPSDYGKIAVSGHLQHCSDQLIAIERDDPQVGAVMVYFPRTGFDMARVN